MVETLQVVHAHGDRVTVTEPTTGVELFAYVYRPEAAWEAPKPYLHPIRTLGGDIVTDYRPNDHRWHKGLQMTASHLSGQNLWGGNSYVHGEGYLALPERVGSMAHAGFDTLGADSDGFTLAERLTWHPYDGELWAEEARRIEVRDVDPAAGSYALTWTSAVTNRRAEPLRFGSPTTHGREMAGYTGLFWRGPRAFRDGRVQTADAEGPDVMGTQAPWLAYSAEHDGADGHATLVFEHAPENDHAGESGAHPAHWFVRNDPFAAVAPSFAYFDELVLKPGATLTRRYRVVVADGAWEREEISKYLEEHPW
ncbi:PmoA family protein [Streptomyces kunmingensis]|uniref:PmoA family protein n=1 Tax=Streptomyces kunmingensis TaxID=68225 RepID=A0ABU6CFG9_9ACTN|nr:PmoA family protein [Streptomyces kunmingensis]MEB3962776.1 PmoA family protein [Streptomyces kunmingensis]